MNVVMCKQKDQNSSQAVHRTYFDELTINLVKKYTNNSTSKLFKEEIMGRSNSIAHDWRL